VGYAPEAVEPTAADARGTTRVLRLRGPVEIVIRQR
jgi:hypothetical protein